MNPYNTLKIISVDYANILLYVPLYYTFKTILYNYKPSKIPLIDYNYVNIYNQLIDKFINFVS